MKAINYLNCIGFCRVLLKFRENYKISYCTQRNLPNFNEHIQDYSQFWLKFKGNARIPTSTC